MNTNENLKIKSLFIAAYIHTKNPSLFKGLEGFDKYTKVFVFAPEASVLEAEYITGSEISAKNLFENYVVLRKMVKEENNGSY